MNEHIYHPNSRITNQYFLDNAACDKEQEKLESYNNLSSTLAKVSPASVAAIAPTLASVIASHSKQSEKVQVDLKRLTDVWEDTTALFAENVCQAIDKRMDSAITRIREEADKEISRIMAAAKKAEVPPTSGGIPKRKYEDEPPRWDDRSSYRDGTPRDSGRYNDRNRSPEGKRARLMSTSYSDSQQKHALGPESRNGGHNNETSLSSRGAVIQSSPVQQAHRSLGQASVQMNSVDMFRIQNSVDSSTVSFGIFAPITTRANRPRTGGKLQWRKCRRTNAKQRAIPPRCRPGRWLLDIACFAIFILAEKKNCNTERSLGIACRHTIPNYVAIVSQPPNLRK